MIFFFNLYLDELEIVNGSINRLGSLNMHIHTFFTRNNQFFTFHIVPVNKLTCIITVRVILHML